MIRRLSLVFAPVFLAAAAAAAPAQIIFLRHAEKPKHGSELNARGVERAKALVGLFLRDRRFHEHGIPIALYAGAPEKEGGSVRSIQTIAPLGQVLHVPVDKQFKRDDVSALVKFLLGNPAYEGRTVVVCWEHKKIPDMLKTLGWTKGPQTWDDAVFDRLWVLDLDHGRPVRFRDEPQRLLSGDSTGEPAAVTAP